MDPLWLEAVKRLAVNPDFQIIWKEGPIHDEIARLEKTLKDPSVRDDVEVATVKNKLYGMEWVRDKVEKLAANPSPEPEPWMSRRRMRRTVEVLKSRYLLRPLG